MSAIEQALAIQFILFVALLITFGAGAAGLAILGDHYGRRLLGWWQRRQERRQERRKSARIATATPRKGGEQYPYTLITPQAKSAPFADNGVRIVLMRPEVDRMCDRSGITPIPAICAKGHEWIDGNGNGAIRAPSLKGCVCFRCGSKLKPHPDYQPKQSAMEL